MSNTSVQNEETDQHRAIVLKNISPSWAEWFDEMVGLHGYVDAIIRCVNGKISNTKFQESFTQEQWRKRRKQSVKAS